MFLLPSLKLKEPSLSGPSVENRLHTFLMDNFDGSRRKRATSSDIGARAADAIPTASIVSSVSPHWTLRSFRC